MRAGIKVAVLKEEGQRDKSFGGRGRESGGHRGGEPPGVTKSVQRLGDHRFKGPEMARVGNLKHDMWL